MTSVEWIDLFHLIPEDQHKQVIFVLRNGIEINIDIVMRLEPEYLVFRGRASGSTEDGRVFFLPYSEITCAYLNRFVKENEIAELFGSIFEGTRAQTAVEDDSAVMAPAALPPASTVVPTPMLITPVSPTSSGLIPRLTSTPAPPMRAPVAPPSAARPVNALIPPVQSAPPTGDTPTPKGGSILERLRAQRGNMNRPK